MGWSAIAPIGRDITFEEAYRGALQETAGPVRMEKRPTPSAIQRAEKRARTEAKAEAEGEGDEGSDPWLKTVEAWLVVDLQSGPHLVVLKLRAFMEKGHLGWWTMGMVAEEGPYISTRPDQALVDEVPVRENLGSEMEFRRREHIWPAGYQPS